MALAFSVVAGIEEGDVVAFGVGVDGKAVGPFPEVLDADFLRTTGFLGANPADAGPKAGATTWVSIAGRPALAVGIGKATPNDLRRAAAAAVRAAAHVPRLVMTLHAGAARAADPPGAARAADPSSAAIGAVVEGAALGHYRYRPPAGEDDRVALAEVALAGPPTPEEAEVRAGRVRAEATIRARDWVNRPSRELRPRRFAEEAAEAGRAAGLEVEVWDEERIAAEGMGLLAGVAAGSTEPPRLVRLTYRPKGTSRGHLALVGKGITFDSGGLSLKPAGSMETMKSDMGGAAAVIAAVLALPELAPDVTVDAWAAMAENMPSGDATRPGDVLTARDGTTVEIVNTDAEGRLVLADAILTAAAADPDALVDVATLTGGQRVALGDEVAGLMGTDDLVAKMTAAGEAAGEPSWRLPLWQGYVSRLDSDVADLRNVSTDNGASTVTAALFLQRFVGERPWAHLDIAAPSYVSKPSGWLTKGATGWGTRTLIELVVGWG